MEMALCGVTVGIMFLLGLRWAMKLLVPLFYLLSIVLSFASGCIMVSMRMEELAVIVSALVMIICGLPLMIHTMIRVVENDTQSQDKRISTIENYLEQMSKTK